jgi:hypothetical protein
MKIRKQRFLGKKQDIIKTQEVLKKELILEMFI